VLQWRRWAESCSISQATLLGSSSNFSRHPVEIDGLAWATTEHYF